MAVPLVISAPSTSTSGSTLSGNLTVPVINSIGGLRIFTRYSGTAGGGQVIYSGAGILKTVQITRRLQSGQPAEFVDTVAFVSGLTGFAGVSGMNILGRVPAVYDNPTQISGAAIDTSMIAYRPIQFDTPFFSGLAFSDTSGTNAFTITYQACQLT